MATWKATSFWTPPGLALLLLCSLGTAEAHAESKAIAGTPFGVAHISLPLSGEAPETMVQSKGYSIQDEQGRVFYPVFSTGRLRRLADRFLGPRAGRGTGTLNVAFLFTGDSPLEVTVLTPEPRRFVLTPQTRRTGHAHHRLLMRWWRAYHGSAEQQKRAGDYPPTLHTYLTSMLSSRLELRRPLLSGREELRSREAGELRQALELLLGAEELREEILRETLRGRPVEEVASRPVPEEILWEPLSVPSQEVAVEVEPMAMHVPAECFYIRFGSFENFRWLSRLMKQYGGDIGRMVTPAGRDDQLNDRFQAQIALKESALADVFGPQVIEDVALVGRDLYLREGAAIGILFQAKNNLGLSSDIKRQRTAALEAKKEKGATLETVAIADRQVSLLSTPDNRLRSFYAVDGNYHLVTTSRSIVKRFLEAGEGRGALGDSPGFQHARQEMPVTRDDALFAYFSSAFFRGLMSPQYQVELERRLKAVSHIELFQLARLAAAAEGRPSATLEDLVQAGFLPEGFGRNADASGPILEADRVVDSLRGARGSFLPVPDVEIAAVTRREAERYSEQALYFQDHWTEMDPLMVAIQRRALEEGLERITVDATVSPLAEGKYGWVLSLLGPPSSQQITSAPGDVITMQAVVKGGLLDPAIPEHHLFVGVQDIAPPEDPGSDAFVKLLGTLRATPGYLGSWPKLGFLDMLPLTRARRADPDGYSRLPLGLWRWQDTGFSVLSFQPEVLDRVTPHLDAEPADSPAQFRLRVGNLADSQLAGFINQLSYDRAREASMGNARLLHALSQQFRVSREQSLEVAQRLLDTELVCALGGQYQLKEVDGQVPAWQSTAWLEASDSPMDEYQAPVLGWLRGLQLELTKVDGRLLLHGEIDMQQKKSEAKFNLPSFDFFGKSKDTESEAEELPAAQQRD